VQLANGDSRTNAFAATLLGPDLEVAGDLVGTGNLSGLGFHRLLFTFRVHWPLQGHHAVLRDYLDVVGVGGKRFVLHKRTPNLLGELAIGGVSFCWSAVGSDWFRSRSLTLVLSAGGAFWLVPVSC
jgi:hypothetical protein